MNYSLFYKQAIFMLAGFLILKIEIRKKKFNSKYFHTNQINKLEYKYNIWLKKNVRNTELIYKNKPYLIKLKKDNLKINI